MECVNCGHAVSEEFCAKCGQRSGLKRITLKDSLADFWTQVSGLDGMFFRTLRDLTMRPGVVANDYIRGIRVKYFGPIGYFFFMITLVLLWLSILGLDFAELIQTKQGLIAEKNNTTLTALITRTVSDNIRWILFLAVPFQAVAARFVLFRKLSFNFAEHMVPLFYTAGHLFWLTLLTFTLRKVTGDFPIIAVTIASLLYFGYVYYSLVAGSRWKAFVKGMGVYIGGQIFFALTLTTLMIIVVVAVALINPDALNAFRPSAR